MTVKLIANTFIRHPYLNDMDWDDESTVVEDLIEYSGRTCYLSFNKPNPKTRANKDYIAHILEVGHYSILEHASATLEVTDVSRNLLIELSRHRHISLSVVSSRYVDMTQFDVIIPPALRTLGAPEKRPLTEDEEERYQDTVEFLIVKGKTRKEAREAAAMELPGGIETRFIMTANLRTWREIFQKRWNVHANAEIREWAGEALEAVRVVAPSVFQDFPTEPFGD